MRYKLKTLTPLHIGDGGRLDRLDMVRSGGKIWVIDIDKIIDRPEIDVEKLAKAMERNFNMKQFLDEGQISPESAAKYSIDCSHDPNQVITQMKDVFNRPYIPGSSIKGAIRTAVLWWKLKNDQELLDQAGDMLQEGLRKQRIKRNQVSKDIEKLVFGNDPNHDLFRALQIGDSLPISTDRLEVQEIKVMNLSQDGYRWKMSLFLENVKRGTESSFDIKLDSFFLKDHVYRKLGFENPRFLTKIPRICREFAEDYMEHEIQFYAEHGHGPESVEGFYSRLLELTRNRRLFLLHLGWGTGWHGMTVASLFPDLIEDMRAKFSMGRRGFQEFPKTRKLASKDGSQLPLGWIYLIHPKRGDAR